MKNNKMYGAIFSGCFLAGVGLGFLLSALIGLRYGMVAGILIGMGLGIVIGQIQLLKHTKD